MAERFNKLPCQSKTTRITYLLGVITKRFNIFLSSNLGQNVLKYQKILT